MIGAIPSHSAAPAAAFNANAAAATATAAAATATAAAVQRAALARGPPARHADPHRPQFFSRRNGGACSLDASRRAAAPAAAC